MDKNVEERFERIERTLEMLAKRHEEGEAARAEADAADKRRRMEAEEADKRRGEYLDMLTKLHLDHARESQERAAKHEQSMAEMRRNHDDFVRQMTTITAGLKDTFDRLGRIMEAHDIRLDDHEGPIDDLEK